MQQDIVRQYAGQWPAEGAAIDRAVSRSVACHAPRRWHRALDPVGDEVAHDTVAASEARDLAAYSRHLADSVGGRRIGQLQIGQQHTLGIQLVAVVQRNR